MALTSILFPVLMAGVTALVPSNRIRPWLLPPVAMVNVVFTLIALTRPDLSGGDAWLALDPIGKIILLLVGILFLFCSLYTVGYLQKRQERSNRVFVACLLVFLGVMTLIAWSHNLGLLWVAIEAATLSTAPLIYFNRSKRSIEATWKYLLIGSVGIALALLGTFFLAYSAVPAGIVPTLSYDELRDNAASLSKPWLRAAFVLLLVGYGTKMGLAPMHTWKPDAYGEAPGVVGAMLAGGLASCAFLAFLRVYHVCVAAGEGGYAARMVLLMGLASMAVAGLFMLGQRDFKRMLAYSSVEHMGILMVGLGIGGPALYGTMLHVVTNGMTKAVLFLSAGNIHRAYGSKTTDAVSGALIRLPLSGALFLVGFLAISGSPPFGPFISEFAILTGAFQTGNYLAAGLFLLCLLVVFVGMGTTVLHVVRGGPRADLSESSYRDNFLTTAPAVAFMAIMLVVGMYIPPQFDALLSDAAIFLGGMP